MQPGDISANRPLCAAKRDPADKEMPIEVEDLLFCTVLACYIHIRITVVGLNLFMVSSWWCSARPVSFPELHFFG